MAVVQAGSSNKVCAQGFASQLKTVVSGNRHPHGVGIDAWVVEHGAKLGLRFVGGNQVIPHVLADETMASVEVVTTADRESEAEVHGLRGGVQRNDNRRADVHVCAWIIVLLIPVSGGRCLRIGTQGCHDEN